MGPPTAPMSLLGEGSEVHEAVPPNDGGVARRPTAFEVAPGGTGDELLRKFTEASYCATSSTVAAPHRAQSAA